MARRVASEMWGWILYPAPVGDLNVFLWTTGSGKDGVGRWTRR